MENSVELMIVKDVWKIIMKFVLNDLYWIKRVRDSNVFDKHFVVDKVVTLARLLLCVDSVKHFYRLRGLCSVFKEAIDEIVEADVDVKQFVVLVENMCYICK